MHRCLTVIEVQHAIFHEAYGEHQGASTIAKLARTCRSFSDTALDVLWKELTSIVYLIRCLPKDLWRIEYTHTGRMVKFQRPMSRADWEIFFRYSSRVRSLTVFDPIFELQDHFLGPRRTTLADDVILTLSHPPGYRSLVPYLKTLCWTRSEESHAPLLQALLCDSLVNLTLPSPLLRSSITSILLTSRCPSLNNLRITENTQEARNHNRMSYSLPHTFLSETILHLHSLESLECSPLDDRAISHLSRLPRLIKLVMGVSNDFRSQRQTPMLIPPAFASLESLTLKANTLSTLTSLLEIIRFRPQCVSFIVKTVPTLDTLCLLFMALVNACDSEQLSGISLTTELPLVHDGTHRPQIALSTFQSLLTLPNVTSFTLDVMCDISLDDDTIETITNHWPKLTKLSLNPSFGWGVAAGMTHRGLITLLSNCPFLAEFALMVDVSEVDRPNSQVPTSRPGKGIASNCQSAYFIESAITFPVSVAAFLSDICPRLRRVDLLCSDMVPSRRSMESQEWLRKWDEVNSLLPALLAVREQCAEWYRLGGQKGEE